jgi:hypothetical protein
MAVLKRKDEGFERTHNELNTADLAKSGEKADDPEPRRVSPQNVPGSTSPLGKEDPDLRESSAPAGRPATTPSEFDSPAVPADSQPAPLFSESEVGQFRAQWSDIQSDFVDEPRRAVEDADNLVFLLMKKLAEGFANERQQLEKQWDRGDYVSTEDLRVALQHYRSFFDRLLKV